MSDTSSVHRLGWLRDLPSINDYTADHNAVKPMVTKLNNS